MQDLTTMFKVLSDPIRLRLAALFSIKGEICVCMLAEALREPNSKISRHLGIMRSNGIVEARRQEQWMYYKLAKPNCNFGKKLQGLLKNYMTEYDIIKKDLSRLEKATCKK